MSDTTQSSFHDQRMSLVHENFPHLYTVEWDALKRLAVAVGDTLVTSLLCQRGPDEHRAAAIEFLGRKVTQVRAERDALQTTCRSSAVPTAGRVKLDVLTYSGSDREPLLRWFAEVELALRVQRVTDDLARVAFAMSKLTGRARSWAFSRHMADASCFRDLAALKSELRAAFEPSKSEFRLRTEFLDLRQGSLDLHEYVQKLRYLAASIVDEPIDMATQVATFMKGLRDGPVNKFREFPSTLEAAISLAQQNEFSCRQARAHSTRGAARHEAKPMDLSMVQQHAPFRRDAPPPVRREHFARDDTRGVTTAVVKGTMPPNVALRPRWPSSSAASVEAGAATQKTSWSSRRGSPYWPSLGAGEYSGAPTPRPSRASGTSHHCLQQ